MRIKRVRLVLPARMRHSAHLDARLIATSAARALQASNARIDNVSTIVDGQGQPANSIARDVARATRREIDKGEG
jgi:hypothetical protein